MYLFITCMEIPWRVYKKIACVCTKLLQSCLTLVAPWTVACQAPLTMEFSRQEYWSELPFPIQGIFLTQGPNPHLLHLPALADMFLTTSAKLVIASFGGRGWGHSWGRPEGALFCTVCPFGTLSVIKQQFRAHACLGSNPCCATYQLHDLEQVSILYFKL